MTKTLDRQRRLLLEQEKRFAKRVVYVMRARNPPPWWHLLIPFRFLLEYFSFRKNVRRFTEKYLLLKRMALSAACRAVEHGDRNKSRREMQSELRDFWMHDQRIDSRELYERLGEMADLLLEHYCRLLETGEKEYTSMIRKAYRVPSEYREHLEGMERVEGKIDQAAHAAFGLEAHDPYILNRQEAMREARRQDMAEIFR